MGIRQLTSIVAVSLCVLAGVLSYCDTPASAARGHVFDTSFGVKGSGDGQLDEPADVAVNESTHNVYVVDEGNDRVEEFSPTGSYIGQFNGSGTLAGEGSAAPTGEFSAPEGIAVDNSINPLDPSAGDVYVVDSGHKVIDKFSSTGSYIGQLTEGSPGSVFLKLDGVAVDQNGTLWVDRYEFREIDSFSDAISNEFLSARESRVGGEPGFAVDSEDDLYVDWSAANFFTVVAKLNSTGNFFSEEIDPSNGSTVGAEVDPGEDTSAVAVDLSTNDLYVDNISSIGVFSPVLKSLERFGSGTLEHGAGLAIDSSSGIVYVADAATDTVDVFELEPFSPPVVESEWATDVASTSATFNAQINPRGSSTEYRFEYGPSTSYGTSAPIPDSFIGSGFGGSDVSIHRAELLADTTYHYRVVAHNEKGIVDGPDHTFTTQAVGGQELVLPDDRAWELVSPPDKKGALIEPFNSGTIEAASNGSGITYLSEGPEIGEGSQGKFTFSQVLSTRGDDGWRSQDLTLPSSLPQEGTRTSGSLKNFNLEYAFFSSDLSLAAAEPQPKRTPALAPGVSERTIYLRGNLNASFAPLVSSANVPPGTKFGEGEDPEAGLHVLAATPDMGHVVLESPLALTPEATSTGDGHSNLYEWSAGQLRLVNVLPDGQVANSDGNVSLGGQIGTGPSEAARSLGGVSRAMSDDGRLIAWTWGWPQEPSSYQGLYVRNMVEGKTVQVGGSDARLQGMSSDGSRIFYLEDGDLYEYNYGTATETDLTPNYGAGESAGVQELPLGISEDGSHVYFMADGVLSSSTNASGEAATPGHCVNSLPQHEAKTDVTCNLYLLRYNDGEWEAPKYIARLSSEDEASWWSAGFAGVPDLPGISARVSPDGRYLTFMSERSLTGYDNIDAYENVPDEEVYLYDSVSGKLVCASCNPTGGRPVGVLDKGSVASASQVGNLVVDRKSTWGEGRAPGSKEHLLAASLPGWDEKGIEIGIYQPRYLSDSGRLFFDSPDALVPQDTNGLEDVYEYEPPRSGETAASDSCTTGSSTFSALSGGCVNLISSGISSDESAFFDASENGDDVFFITSGRLTSADYDSSYDVYDAHVCSTVAPCSSEPVSPPPCTSGDSCKAAPSPQPAIFGPAPSATFNGIGNVTGSQPKPVVKAKSLTRAQKLASALRLCHMEKARKKRRVCEREAHRRYSTSQSRKATAKKGTR